MNPPDPLAPPITPTTPQVITTTSSRWVPKTVAATHAINNLLALNNLGETLSPEQIIAKLTANPCEHFLSKWFTQDDAMSRVKNAVRRLSNLNEPVLITGPTGTGKELLARALQGNRNGAFLAVNCGALPEKLVPSLFFGHKKGAFTGANEDRDGLLTQAAGGTVFLDEIAELPLHLQAVLLRAIQENEITPVGALKSQPISCRFIAATKHDLRELVSKDSFREDLFARLMTFELKTSGLVDREGDVDFIAAKAFGYTEPVLAIHPNRPDLWKFNVRGIRTYVERMRVLGHY